MVFLVVIFKFGILFLFLFFLCRLEKGGEMRGEGGSKELMENIWDNFYLLGAWSNRRSLIEEYTIRFSDVRDELF